MSRRRTSPARSHALVLESFSGQSACSSVTFNTNTYTVRARVCPLSGRSFRLSYENWSTNGVSSRPLTPASSNASRSAASNNVSSASQPPFGNTRFRSPSSRTSSLRPSTLDPLAHRRDETSRNSTGRPVPSPPRTGIQQASRRPCPAVVGERETVALDGVVVELESKVERDIRRVHTRVPATPHEVPPRFRMVRDTVQLVGTEDCDSPPATKTNRLARFNSIQTTKTEFSKGPFRWLSTQVDGTRALRRLIECRDARESK